MEKLAKYKTVQVYMPTHNKMIDEMEPIIYELKRQKSLGGVQGKMDPHTKPKRANACRL